MPTSDGAARAIDPFTPTAADIIGSVVGAIGEIRKMLDEADPHALPDDDNSAAQLLGRLQGAVIGVQSRLAVVWPELCDIERELTAPFETDAEVA